MQGKLGGIFGTRRRDKARKELGKNVTKMYRAFRLRARKKKESFPERAARNVRHMRNFD